MKFAFLWISRCWLDMFWQTTSILSAHLTLLLQPNPGWQIQKVWKKLLQLQRPMRQGDHFLGSHPTQKDHSIARPLQHRRWDQDSPQFTKTLASTLDLVMQSLRSCSQLPDDGPFFCDVFLRDRTHESNMNGWNGDFSMVFEFKSYVEFWRSLGFIFPIQHVWDCHNPLWELYGNWLETLVILVQLDDRSLEILVGKGSVFAQAGVS